MYVLTVRFLLRAVLCPPRVLLSGAYKHCKPIVLPLKSKKHPFLLGIRHVLISCFFVYGTQMNIQNDTAELGEVQHQMRGAQTQKTALDTQKRELATQQSQLRGQLQTEQRNHETTLTALNTSNERIEAQKTQIEGKTAEKERLVR